MIDRATVRWAAAALTGLLFTSCGGSGEATVPNPEELAGRLLTVEDLGGEWRLAPGLEPGILTDEMKAEMRSLTLCEEAGADAVAVAANLDWQAGTGFSLGEPADDDGVPWVLEAVLTGDRTEIEATFETLRTGAVACIGVEGYSEDIGTRIEEISLPIVGDDRVGLLFRQIDRPEGSDRLHLRDAIVRRGAVIVWLSNIEVSTAGDPGVTESQFNDIVAAAIAKLP